MFHFYKQIKQKIRAKLCGPTVYICTRKGCTSISVTLIWRKSQINYTPLTAHTRSAAQRPADKECAVSSCSAVAES